MDLTVVTVILDMNMLILFFYDGKMLMILVTVVNHILQG